MNFEQAAKKFGITMLDAVSYALTQEVYLDAHMQADVIDKDGNEYRATWDVSRLLSDDGQHLELDDINYALADEIREI